MQYFVDNYDLLWLQIFIKSSDIYYGIVKSQFNRLFNLQNNSALETFEHSGTLFLVNKRSKV